MRTHTSSIMMAEYLRSRKSRSISLRSTPSVMNLMRVLSVTVPVYLNETTHNPNSQYWKDDEVEKMKGFCSINPSGAHNR